MDCHYLSLSVLRLNNASRIAMIHNRTTTFGSSQPFISKCFDMIAIISIAVHYLSLRVLRLNNASRIAMIHNRTTTFGSSQPFISKW
jgi:hypothetical protein